MNKLAFMVPAEAAGTRLDLFLVPLLQSESRASIQRLIRIRAVFLNGKETKASHKVQKDDHIEVEPERKMQSAETLEPWEYPLPILYEDKALLAVDKPAHLVVHPGAGRSRNTLVHALLSLRPEIKSVGHPARPGVVHRLDKETSGILLVAKTQQAYFTLTAMFKDRRIEKHYRALAFGTFSHQQGKIDRAIGRDSRDRKKISVRARKLRQAVTLYRVLRAYSFGALLDIHILTGRTQQIRVHLSSEGHPIVGDTKYGGGNWPRIPNQQLRDSLKNRNFFGLHAFTLDFEHPLTGSPLHLEAPLPTTWNPLSSYTGELLRP